jgi:hypothetical protein
VSCRSERNVFVAEGIAFSWDELDNLATKLDEFAKVLSDKERAMLHTLQFGRPAGPLRSARLSDGFREAFERGCGTVFTIDRQGHTRQGGSVQGF